MAEREEPGSPESQIQRAVQDTLSGYHRQIEAIDQRLAERVHRREELVAAARLALISRLPPSIQTNLQEFLAARPPTLALPGSEHVAELAAVVAREADTFQERLRGYHQEIEAIDKELAELVHQREELVAAARLSLIQGVPENIRGELAQFAPRVAMALACL